MNGMPDGVDDCKDYMPGNADGNGHYKCDRTEGSPDMEVPFQFYLVEFVGRGSESKCVSGSSPEVSFDVRSVRYLDTSDIEPVLRNNEIDCALATRNPQPSAANTKMLAVIATQSTTEHDRIRKRKTDLFDLTCWEQRMEAPDALAALH